MSTALTTTRPTSAVVLVVDPDPASQRAIRDRLNSLGYTARSVDDYESALDVIENTPPDVVLLPRAEEVEGLTNLQAELNRYGIPLLNMQEAAGTAEAASPASPAALDNTQLKQCVDAAVESRTLQDALIAENARLTAERLHDPVTGLFNRRYIMIRVEEEVQRSTRRGHPLSCMLVDLDGFEKVNERWGHQVGDAVLRDMAHICTRTLRTTDIACRYRDDQFLVLLTDTDASGAQIAANRLRDAVLSHNFYNPAGGAPLKMTASVGVAYWQPMAKAGQPTTWEPQLIGLSERAVKAAKQSGTNRLVILQAT